MSITIRRYRAITAAYWFLLLYVVAALIWWFISLEQQNHAMYDLRTSGLTADDAGHERKLAEAADVLRRKHAQYIGEGVIFLLLILAGAVLVFRAIRKELKLSQQQHNFMMAITHELKTPIAAARLNIETVRRHQLDEARREKLLSSTLAETERLNELADNILLATRMDSAHFELQREPVDLEPLAEAVITLMQQRYPRMQWHLQPGAAKTVVAGEAVLLRLMMTNLLDNAAKYAYAGGEGRLELENAGSRLLITIADKGPGIPDEEKIRIFQKFYRIGSEASRQAKGTGLGLYLVERIVKDHGGSITVADGQPKGTRFIISLPLAQPTL